MNVWDVWKQKLSLKPFLVAGLAIALAASCTKKRDAQFEQGEGIYLDTVSAYDGKEFKLITGDARTFSNTSKAPEIRISEELSKSNVNLNNFPLVSYETSAKLLGTSFPFRGKPHHEYKIRYGLTNKKLVIYKIAPKADLPYQELPYAEDKKDGTFAVPLVSYNVKGFYHIEQKLNESNERTYKYKLMEERDRARATHLDIDFYSRTVFEGVQKVDVFPSELFAEKDPNTDEDNVWYFAETVIDTSEERKNEIGEAASTDLKIQEATRVKFVPVESKLRAVNLSIDERLLAKKKTKRSADDEELNLSPVLEIPIQRKDFRIVNKGLENELKEEEHSENPWKKRKYLQINFDQVWTPGRKDSSGNKLVDVEFDKDYISFTIFRAKEGVRAKYSFYKSEDRKYAARRFFRDDLRHFGYLHSIKPTIDNYQIYRKQDVDTRRFMNRFNPSKPIVYHFAFGNQKVDKYREVGREAIKAWNEAFKRAGVSTRILLDESKDVQLGDLRYNIINLVDSYTQNGLLGFGPSVTDPTTGEIISATANMHINHFRAILVDHLRRYVMDGVKIVDQVKTTLPYHPPFAGKNLSTQIKAQCPEVDAYVAELNHESLEARKKALAENSLSEEVTYLDTELGVLEECAERLLPGRLLSTLVHEIGHNFGLYHNFMGSADGDHYYTVDEFKDFVAAMDGKQELHIGTKEAVRLSSAMDYPDFDEDRLTIPGKYDVAAIMYGYGDQIADKKGNRYTISSKLTLDKNIEKIAGAHGLEPKALETYKDCNDYDLAVSTDPLCQKFDMGANPSEAMDHLISDYDSIHRSFAFRYDRRELKNGQSALKSKQILFYDRAKRFYDEWRYHFAQFMGAGNEYLQNLSIEEYQQLLKKMEADPKFGESYRLYYPAAQKAYAFLKSIAFTPNRYCVVSKNGEKDIVELEKVRSDIFKRSKHSVSHCIDPDDRALNAYYSDNGWTPVDEIGQFINEVRYSLRQEDNNDPLDVLGYKYDRLSAFQALTQRETRSKKLGDNSYLFNFVDEPVFREDLFATLKERVFNGISLPEFGIKNKPKFQADRELLATWISEYANALYVPNDPQTNYTRRIPFQIAKLDNPKNIGNPVAYLANGSEYFIAISKENTFTIDLIDKFGELENKKVPPNREKVEQLLAILKQAKPDSELQEMSADEFIRYNETLGDGLDSASGALPNLQDFMSRFYPSLMQRMNLAREIRSKRSEITDIKMKVRDLVGAQWAVSTASSQEVANTEKEVEQYYANWNKRYQDYLDNKTDYQAQSGLMIQILNSASEKFPRPVYAKEQEQTE